MKKTIMLCLLLITVIACKKTTSAPKSSTPPSTTSTGTYVGTFVNSTDITDQIKFVQCSNSSTGGIRYVMSGYRYDDYSTGHDTVLETQLTTNPYYHSHQPGPNNWSVLGATSTIILKVQLMSGANVVGSTFTYNKQ